MPQDGFSTERRAIPRNLHSFKASVAEFVFPMSSQPEFSAQCVDMTPRGAMLQVEAVIPKGSVQQVSIQLPGFEKSIPNRHILACDAPYQIRVVSRVIWTEEENDSSMIGVEFLNMSKNAERVLGKYLQETLKKS
ncbi:MAG: PilZ domain-containing protein [Desulfovibrionales bacterium]|nr:PilZ domain-containing protein [Desulfovibrionales bacterium]